MLRLYGAATFQDVPEADEVGVDVGGGLLEAVANSGLGGQVDHAVGLGLGEQRRHRFAIGQVDGRVAIALARFKPRKARLFQRRVVVGVEIVQPHHSVAAIQQPMRDVGADEAGRAGDQDNRHAAGLYSRRGRVTPVRYRRRRSGARHDP